MKLPDKWGPGAIFAFSGLNGENTYSGSLAGILSADRIGVRFPTQGRFELAYCLDGVQDIVFQAVTSDLIRARLTRAEGSHARLVMLFIAQDTITGLSPDCAPVRLFFEEDAQEQQTGCEKTYALREGFLALTRRAHRCGSKYALAWSKISRDDALEKARAGLHTEIRPLVQQRLAFYESLPVPVTESGDRAERLYYKCFSVMKSQVYTPEGLFTTRWTTPDRLPHRRLWLWDSVFHALGNCHISASLAEDTIRAVLSLQRADGFIPHMASPDGCSAITQPPVLAWGIYRLYTQVGNISFLRETYGALNRYMEWLRLNRDTDLNELYEWEINPGNERCRCDECGMDNSPRFDNVEEMDCVDFSCYMANEARHLARIARALGLVDDEVHWNARFLRIRDAVNRFLWDEKDGYYYDRPVGGGTLRKVRAISSFLPLFAGVCPPDRARRLVQHLTNRREFNTPLPIPSVALDDPSFGTDMWRGPVWINFNYMIACGLEEYGYGAVARNIVHRTIDAAAFWYAQDGVVYEFYDGLGRLSPSHLSRKGKNLRPYDFRIRMQSIRDYGWSCALLAAMMLEDGEGGPGKPSADASSLL